MSVDVTVEPTEFLHVEFDAGVLADLVRTIATDIGLDGSITLQVDESTPLGFSELASIDPIVITAESGALEDPKVLRRYAPELAADVLGRHLLRARDRLDPTFGEVPADRDLSVRQVAAWDTYTVGRLVRMGHAAQRQRRLYQFRNRHGFTDAADSAFEQLWAGESLTWDDIERISVDAVEAKSDQLAG
jgi:hypothetical protein